MSRKHLKYIVFGLLLMMIFEGITRKMMPPTISKMMIFAKDGFVILILFGTITKRYKGTLANIKNYLLFFAFALTPLIAYTAIKDPVLALFGTKQYLLFPFTVFGVVAAFSNYNIREFTQPLRFMILLLFPLTTLAVIQIFLPDSHWLNLSVTGEDLSAFKAGGRLRVSSTFPFVAQFCYYLTILLPCILTYLTFKNKNSKKGILDRIESLVVILPFFIVANVVTGSRLAVVTNVMTIAIATGLLAMRGQSKNIGRLVGFILVIIISVFIARAVLPETFEAYEARAGDSTVVDREELSERGRNALLGWWHLYQYKNPGLLGYGIGTMSNGVQNFSAYAVHVKDIAWGETDLGNTILEGGLYLVFIFQLFRILVIIECYKVFTRIQSHKLSFVATFILGYIIFNGLTQTLGTQPPLAIWWWFAIGLLIHIQRFEQFLMYQKKQRIKGTKPSQKSNVRPPKPPPPLSGNSKPLPTGS